ncbi:hypothetical protein TWF569_008320 [Orbilia oligospora]|uniref:Uncharacterized protein n=1 Tax=Orbilia oligospora TaxID=2813651 RepID=A0A7C8NK77_ORBOL|nr:hypothetical protein TWF706_006989 [Orbilia oligospora]KAF3112075.1 hypothetical protein TWF102_005820 [Orbilia oligospora]KAF3113309.1 hypothetical protein TWF103_002471 [Orbilia oligospora]KAF3140180.1 hypothetical protein TWF569_008320 [Orbilia oligospora]
MCVELQGWETRLKFSGGNLASILGAASLRYKTTLDTLAMITGMFAEVDQLNEKYGITCNSPDLHRISSVRSSPPETSKKGNRNSWISRIRFGSKEPPKKGPSALS